MTPLSPEEARWARTVGLLQKQEGYFDTLKSDPRKAIGCILGALFVIATIPIATDGKLRLHRCKVVGEKDLKEIGLIE